MGVPCAANNIETCSQSELERIDKFRKKFLQIIFDIKEKKPKWGFWLSTCFEHVYQGSWAWYGQSKNVYNKELDVKMSLRDALNFWYNEGNISGFNKAKFIDVLDWKHNENCKLKTPEFHEVNIIIVTIAIFDNKIFIRSFKL